MIADGEKTTWVWWGAMLAIVFLNAYFYIKTVGAASQKVPPGASRSLQKYMWRMKWLAVPFVFECAWRSVFPSIYNARQTLFDTPLNAILVDRSLAALGEVCWMAQFALALVYIDKQRCQNGHCAIKLSANAIVALAVLGECNSCYSTFTTNALFEVYEAVCWASIGGLACITGWYTYCGVRGLSTNTALTARNFGLLAGISGLIYFPYMCMSDIPRYYAIYKSQDPSSFLGFWEGLIDAATTRHPTRQWTNWKDDAMWMTAYFSVAAWSSILMIHAPRLKIEGEGEKEKEARSKPLLGDIGAGITLV